MATSRITQKDLETLCAKINARLGMPAQPYNDKFEPQAGCYHMSYAYGGAALHQMSFIQGETCTTSPFGPGYCPKRELHGKMVKFLDNCSVNTDDTRY